MCTTIFGHKTNEILTFVTAWRNLEGITPSEMSQSEGEQCCAISLTCGIEGTK